MSPQPLLEIDDLAVSFRVEREVVEAVRGVSFSIGRGETVALVGESGSGKSVTALSIMRLLPYPAAFHPKGRVRFQGTDLLQADESAMRKIRGDRISMIFQEPLTSLNPLHAIEKQVSEVIQIHKGIARAAARPHVIELLKQVGLAEAESRLSAYPHQLSGGQRQRVMIAITLANEPDLLIADEPTTALDVTIQAQILALLKQMKDALSMSMLLITHDLNIVRKMADRVCVMKEGLIVEQGRAREIFEAPRHPYTRHLIEAEPKGKPPSPAADAPLVVEAEGLKVWFPIKRGVLRRTVGHVKAVDGVTLKLREGGTVGVVGESGSGKTTLGLALLRLIPSEGRIVILGERLDGLKQRALRPLRRNMQIVFQDPYGALSPRLSVGEIVGEGLSVHGDRLDRVAREARVSEALAEVGLDPEARHRYPHEFSGGQRQRIAVARAMILKPRFVVLDEPTSALDMSVQAQIVDLLRALQARHKLSYLFISHDLKVVRALADYVIVLRGGVVMEEGPARDVFDRPQTDYTKALMAAAFALEARAGVAEAAALPASAVPAAGRA
jgi:microcin C transport system ATP-binding protein